VREENLAQIYALLGDPEHAVPILQNCYRRRTLDLLSVIR